MNSNSKYRRANTVVVMTFLTALRLRGEYFFSQRGDRRSPLPLRLSAVAGDILIVLCPLRSLRLYLFYSHPLLQPLLAGLIMLAFDRKFSLRFVFLRP